MVVQGVRGAYAKCENAPGARCVVESCKVQGAVRDEGHREMQSVSESSKLQRLSGR